MTIQNRQLSEDYSNAMNSPVFRDRLIAKMADEAMGMLMTYVNDHSSLKTAGDDRAMNLELAIYDYLIKSNPPGDS